MKELLMAAFVGLLLFNYFKSGSSSEPDKPRDSAAVSAVKLAIGLNANVDEFKECPIRGGVGVLVDDMAVYWVMNGVAHTANGFAMTWSPSAPKAPIGINLYSVQDACK